MASLAARRINERIRFGGIGGVRLSAGSSFRFGASLRSLQSSSTVPSR
jgi:hypothetical protein